VPGHNLFGVIAKDEEFFVSKEVHCHGQIIGIMLADTKNLAKKAASLVEIEYEMLNQILTIEDAIESNSFLTGYERQIKKGEIDSNTFVIEDEMKGKEFVFEGKCRIGGQEHFYLETHGCLVIPKGENNEMLVYSSTQSVNDVQKEIAYALGVPNNRIVSKVKRLGGGFGGKESRAAHLATCVAVAAHAVQRPVRLALDRDVDMMITGTRHPFLGMYKLRITHDGYFKAYELNMINNAGHSTDLSRAVMERAISHCDNVYKFPILHAFGRLAKTNITSNTA
jgi:xanthine dehydrogenase/oxidase